MQWSPSSEKRFRREKYADYFRCLDRNGNGVIDRNDLGAYASLVQERLRLPKDAPELSRLRATTQAVWASLNEPQDEEDETTTPRRDATQVQLDELVEFFVRLESETTESGELPRAASNHVLAAFCVLDMDGDGFIGVEDYEVYLYAAGSEADARAAFERLDANGDGKISLEQIETLYRDWLCAGSPDAPGNYLLTGQLPEA